MFFEWDKFVYLILKYIFLGIWFIINEIFLIRLILEDWDGHC